MANIEMVASAADFANDIKEMADEVLLAQDLVQQGGVHAISFLLQYGCTEQTAIEMLASLRDNARLIRQEARRRGKPDLFPNDQTGFM